MLPCLVFTCVSERRSLEFDPVLLINKGMCDVWLSRETRQTKNIDDARLATHEWSPTGMLPERAVVGGLFDGRTHSRCCFGSRESCLAFVLSFVLFCNRNRRRPLSSVCSFQRTGTSCSSRASQGTPHRRRRFGRAADRMLRR